MKKENENTGVQKILEIKSLEERIKDLIEIGKKKKYITFEQLETIVKNRDEEYCFTKRVEPMEQIIKLLKK